MDDKSAIIIDSNLKNVTKALLSTANVNAIKGRRH